MKKWSPRLSATSQSSAPLSGTWLVLIGGFFAVAFVWFSLAYRFSTQDAPRAMTLALVAAGAHLLAGLWNVRRGWGAFVWSLAVVVLAGVIAVVVRVFFLVGVEIVAGILTFLGRRALLSGQERG